MATATTGEVTATPVSGGLRPAPTLADGAALLEQLWDSLGQVEALLVRVVDLVVHTQRSGTVEALEGLPLDLLLALRGRLTRSDRGMLRTAADVLRHLPVTFGLWRAGKLSWAQVRGIVTRAKHLRVGDRGALDERIAASVDLIDKLDPDQLLWDVDQAVDELDGARAVERREQRTVERNFLWVQQAFDGSSRGTFGLHPIGTATLTNALDAAARDRDHRERGGDTPPSAGGHGDHHDDRGDVDDGEPGGCGRGAGARP